VRWPAPKVSSSEQQEINGITYWYIEGQWMTREEIVNMWGDGDGPWVDEALSELESITK